MPHLNAGLNYINLIKTKLYKSILNFYLNKLFINLYLNKHLKKPNINLMLNIWIISLEYE